MPTRFTLVLDRGSVAGGNVLATHVHAAVCEALERAQRLDHRAQTKPFSVGMLHSPPGRPAEVHLDIGWLDDDRDAETQLRRIGGVTLGAHQFRVRRLSSRRCPYDLLWVQEPSDAWLYRFDSPTYFDLRHGRRGLLPDPFLLIRGLAASWNNFRPAALPSVEPPTVQALQDGLIIADLSLGTDDLPVRNRASGEGKVETRRGFIGDVLLRLPTPTPATAQWLSVLSRLARYAGIGAATTHGFGSVTTSPWHGSALQ